MLPEPATANEDIMLVRYLDRYEKEDGRWRFAHRDVMFDYEMVRPIDVPDEVHPEKDASYEILGGRLFARGSID